VLLVYRGRVSSEAQEHDHAERACAIPAPATRDRGKQARRHGDANSGHHHGAGTNSDKRYLLVALTLLAAFFVVEVVVAVVSGSLALLSDAGHMLSDIGALGASLWAIRLAARPASGAWTWGWKRAEILSAAGNGISLLVISAIVAVEAVQRLVSPHDVIGGAVLAVALVGVAVNLAAAATLARANRSSLNVEGAYKHILTDLYGFIGTIIAAVVIIASGWTRADAVASLLVVVLMVHAAWGLLRDSGRVLFEAAPGHIDLEDIREHLLATDHVLDIHDLHVWTVTSDLPALSAHVVLDDGCFHDGHAPQLLDQLQDCLVGHFDVEHSTFQFEPLSHGRHEIGAH
jgi:cobalt-zinc-cadmium efflux system protein